MKFIILLKELWQRRNLVVAAFAAAVLVATLAVYDVSPLPPSLSKRDHSEAHGSVEILVDSAISPIGDVRRQLTPLSERAGIFARYIAGGEVIAELAKDTGIPAKQIQAVGPTALPGMAPGSETAEPTILPYGIEIVQRDTLPILDVATRAPSVAEARALAAAVPGALRRMVSSIQQEQEVPLGKRVTFRALGPALANTDTEALGAKVALAVFLLVFVLLLLLLLGVPRFIEAWHRAGEEPLPHEPVHALEPLPATPLADRARARALAPAEEVVERAQPGRGDDG